MGERKRRRYCRRGHDINVVGRDSGGRCNACERQRAADRRSNDKLRRATLTAPDGGLMPGDSLGLRTGVWVWSKAALASRETLAVHADFILKNDAWGELDQYFMALLAEGWLEDHPNAPVNEFPYQRMGWDQLDTFEAYHELFEYAKGLPKHPKAVAVATATVTAALTEGDE